MSEYTNFNPFTQMEMDMDAAYHAAAEEGVIASNHPTPGGTASNPPTPQHTEPFDTPLPSTYPLGVDIPHWETIQHHMQGQYQQHQEYHSHHTSPMHSTTPTPNAFHIVPIPHDATLEPPTHTVPSQSHPSHQSGYGYAQPQQGQASPNIDNAPILLLPPDAVHQQAPRHRVPSGEMSYSTSTTPTGTSLLLQPDRNSPAPVASGSRSKPKPDSSAQGGVVRTTRSTKARTQIAAAAPYHPRPAPGAPAGRLGGIMGGSQATAPSAPPARQTRQSAVRFSSHTSASMERKVSGGSTNMPSPSEFRVPGSAAGSPHAPSPAQLSPPLPTPSNPPAAPTPAQGMGGGMFTFHSKNRVTASTSTPSPFSMPTATSSKSKSKSTARPSAPRPPPVVTEFVDAEDRLPSIPEGKENESQRPPNASRTQEPQQRPSSRRSTGPSSEASTSRASHRYEPYSQALQKVKLKAFQTANIPSYAPRTDIFYEHEGNFMVASLELPGVKRDDLHITLGTSKFNHVKFVHILAISRPVFDRTSSKSAPTEVSREESTEDQANEETPGPAAKSEAQEASSVPLKSTNPSTGMAIVQAQMISPDVRERKFGVLKRAFPVPSFTKIDDLDASLEDGVLTLRMFCGQPNELDDEQEVPVR